jgi:hypothetical protein
VRHGFVGVLLPFGLRVWHRLTPLDGLLGESERFRRSCELSISAGPSAGALEPDRGAVSRARVPATTSSSIQSWRVPRRKATEGDPRARRDTLIPPLAHLLPSRRRPPEPLVPADHLGQDDSVCLTGEVASTGMDM